MRAKYVALLAMCISSPLVAQRASAPKRAFREHAAAYAAAVNKRDATAVAALFTPDGDEVFVDGPRIVGRDAITGVRMLSPNIAIVESVATFSEGPIRSNRGTAVMVRQGGKWLTAALRVYPAVTPER